jgi:hypothetical protein
MGQVTGWNWASLFLGYSSVAIVALYLLDRSHGRALTKLLEIYDQQTNYQKLMIEQLRRALDALKKVGG